MRPICHPEHSEGSENINVGVYRSFATLRMTSIIRVSKLKNKWEIYIKKNGRVFLHVHLCSGTRD